MSAPAVRPLPPLPSVAPLAPPADLGARLAELGVSLDPAVVQRLGAYLALLLAMNAALNLTAVRDPDEAWSKHALDALSLLPELADLPAGARLLAVGSGGGVPGLVLAIARPDLHVTLIESTQKKAAFLEAAAKALSLVEPVVAPLPDDELLLPLVPEPLLLSELPPALFPLPEAVATSLLLLPAVEPLLPPDS